MTPHPLKKLNVSLIIPVLNEAEALPSLLSSLESAAFQEVIIVDAGSADASWALLLEWKKNEPAQFQRMIVKGVRGRGQQMNVGAKIATGDILVFLHVDTQLPAKALDVILQNSRDSKIVGGAFSLHIQSRHLFLRLVNLVANLRVKWFRLPYGDQVFFVRRAVFQKMEGYANIALMEDVDFFRRLKKEGAIVICDETASTSARRWLKKGIYTTSLRNLAFLFLYFVGVSPQRLAKWYYS